MGRADILDMIQRYIEAEKAVLEGKSITFNGQQMSLESLSEIIKGRRAWERRLSDFDNATRGRPKYKLARFK